MRKAIKIDIYQTMMKRSLWWLWEDRNMGEENIKEDIWISGRTRNMEIITNQELWSYTFMRISSH
jgi:hypothetical protein